MECEYCGASFTKRYNLTVHQRTAKYCLKLRYKSPEHKCEGCKDYFFTELVLNKHQDDCKEYIKLLKVKCEEKDIKLKEKDVIIQEKDTEIYELEIEIEKLKEKLANDEGKISVLKEKSTTTVNIHPKLKNVECSTIQPFTIETVKKAVEEGKYTYEHFIRGDKGIVDFIKGIITSEEDGKQRNYICTDTARNKFHRLIETRAWENDYGAIFLGNVFDELTENARNYYDKILQTTRIREQQEAAHDLLDKVKPIYFGISTPKSKDRDRLFDSVRAQIRKYTFI